MTRRAWGNASDLILALLRQHSRLTELELVRLTEFTQPQVAAALQRLRADSPRLGKRVYRCAWVSGQPGLKVPHLSPVWAAGSLPCAARPPAISPNMSRPARRALKAKRHEYTTAAVMRAGHA